MGDRQAVCGGNLPRMALTLKLRKYTEDNGKWEGMGHGTGE